MNYRQIWEKTYGPIPTDDTGRKYEIHHIDGNKKNNSIENLKCISIEEHYKIHLNQIWKAVTCPHCSKQGGINIMKRWHFENCKNKT